MPIGRHHLLDEFLKCSGSRPAQLLPGLGCISQQLFHFRGTEIAWIDGNKHSSGLLIHALFLLTLAPPDDGVADHGKGAFNELPYRMHPAGGQNIVVGLFLLQDSPHTLDIVPRVPSVALRVEVTEGYKVS